MVERAAGWRRAAPEEARDRDSRRHLGAGPVPRTANNFDLITFLDQFHLNSCVAFAIANLVRGAMILKGAKDPELLSCLGLYWWARAYLKEQDIDAGAFIHLAFAALNQFGYARDSAWPYDVSGDEKDATGKIIKKASWRRMPPFTLHDAFDQKHPTDYRRIMTSGGARVDDWKRAHGQRRLVVFGTDITRAFGRGEVGPLVHRPGPGDEISGGHAMLSYGHDDEGALVVNSWSKEWNGTGTCKLSWEYLEDKITDDIWFAADVPLWPEQAMA